MNLLSVLHSQATLAFVLLAVLVLKRNYRSVLNRTIGVIMLCFAIWNLADIFHHDPTQPLATIRISANVGAVGWVTFPILFLVFAVALHRPGTTRLPWWQYPVIAIPPALFFWQQLAGNLNAGHVNSPYGWTTVWSDSIWTPLYFGYYVFTMVVGMFLTIRFWVRARHVYERRQARLFVVTGLIALALGTNFNVILPVILGRPSPEIAPLAGLIWAIGLYVGVARYGMLSLTPQAAADDVLATMSDAVLLISPDGRVESANRAAGELFGIPLPELAGRPADRLVGPEVGFERLNRHILDGGPLGPWETDIAARGGRTLSLSVTGRTLRDRHGETAGYVWVLRDITRRKQAERDLVKSYEQLEHRVEERAAQLTAANRDLNEEIANHRRVERERDRARRELQALFDNTEVLLWSIFEADDGRLCYERVNRAFAAVEGFEPEHYNGRRLADIHAPEQVKHIEYSVSRARSGKPHVYPVSFQRGSETRHYEIRLIPVIEPDGSVRRFIGAGTDVTGFRRALDRLEGLPGDRTSRPRPV
ncbi:PAS domain-containing protein [candidate division WOR-3 bacterium]|nr:PAS domain-containing protein [candidate division WOR-3 bacterium]